MKTTGIVYLVGAGPGDPGLLTLRGAELLSRAQVVVYDELVNRDLLRLVPANAEIIYGGKHDRTRALPQDKLNELLVAKARQGKSVVRLKGGDPYVFARGGEEAELLAAAGIEFEVVPGVSSAEAVPNYAGIPLTHRNHSSSYTVVTGHECPGENGTKIDWARLVSIPGTLVILMGLKQIRRIAEILVAEGRNAETPAALISWGTTGRQQTVTGTLATIADLAAQANLAPPVVTVIGEVVKLRQRLNWFEKRPLLGQRIVVTRARDQAAQLAQPLRQRGAEVMEIPTIKLGPPKQRAPILEAISSLNEYDWLIFTSPNGVKAFFDLFFKGFQDLRDIGGVRIAAVGPGTAAKLKELHLQVDVMPDEFITAKIAKALTDFQSLENLRILLLRAEVANPELPKQLEDLGAIVDDIACYQTVGETEDITGAAARLVESGADWITFTSGSTIEHFHARFNLPRLLGQFPQIKLATIGPETSKVLAALGLQPTVEANPHTIDGLIQALERSVVGMKPKLNM
jgi:uroporphyrinogen III methyltransferase/synthase